MSGQGHAYDPALPVVVIGCGGHGRVAATAMAATGRRVIAATDASPDAVRRELLRPNANGAVADVSNGGEAYDAASIAWRQPGFEILTDQELVQRYRPDDIELVLGVGSLVPCGEGSPRRQIVGLFRRHGFRFARLVHPAAWVAPDARLGEGVQVHAGAIVQPGTVLGEFAIVNTRASIDHDCRVGAFCHLAPGVSLSGDVTVGDGTHLGTGCNVIQGLKIGQRAFVAAGATVVADVDDDAWVRGLPAKRWR